MGVPVVQGELKKMLPDVLHPMGYPRGLALNVQSSLASSPLRFWIVDNSYSMNAFDGMRVTSSRGGVRVMRCSRTDELKDAVLHQAELSSRLGARTDFHHLNVPPSDGRSAPPRCISLVRHDDTSSRCASIGDQCTTAEEAMARLTAAIVPCGSTPLTAAVNEIHGLLAPVAAQLRERGERAVVVIATDGRPNSPHDFLRALQLLQARCPVWVVVRLCTSDASIVDYWTSLDRELERPLEVLDDQFGEALEIGAHNEWLSYGAPLHAARLFGLQHKAFDLLDERALSPREIKQFCELLFGCAPLPEPELEPEAFIQALTAVIAPLPLVFDPRLRKPRPWVDVVKVARRMRVDALARSGVPPCLLGCM